jgi:hypothetical protein
MFHINTQLQFDNYSPQALEESIVSIKFQGIGLEKYLRI